jgi:hypothetical protein
MSLVYDKNSDEIRCVFHVNIRETEVCDTYYLMYWNIKLSVATRVGESTYMHSPK